jgi:flagellar FliL protein
MKKLIVAVVALLLLGGVGFAAYTYFGTPAEAAAVEGDKADAATKEQAGKDKAAADAAIAFVKMDSLVLPIVGKNGVSQVINLSVTLEVKDELTAKEIEKLTPRLRDAFIQDMYGVLTQKSAMADGVVQVDFIKARLNKMTEKVLGPDKVKDVLLQTLQQRKV